MTLLQRAVSPRLSQAYLSEGYDRVGGFVVRVSDVRFATSTADLAAVHGLHAADSGWTAQSPWIDLLRFEADWYLRYLGEPGYAVPLWWLMHTRVPPGAQLMRRYADGGMELLARYGHLGTGWRPADPGRSVPRMAQLTQSVGTVAQWQGQTFDAELVDGRVILATSEPPDPQWGFWPGAPGRWYRQVLASEVSDLFGVEVTARWQGMAVAVVDQVTSRGQDLVRIAPLGDDIGTARSLSMVPLGADTFQAWVARSDLTELTALRWKAPDTSGWQPATDADDSIPVPGLFDEHPLPKDRLVSNNTAEIPVLRREFDPPLDPTV